MAQPERGRRQRRAPLSNPRSPSRSEDRRSCCAKATPSLGSIPSRPWTRFFCACPARRSADGSTSRTQMAARRRRRSAGESHRPATASGLRAAAITCSRPWWQWSANGTWPSWTRPQSLQRSTLRGAPCLGFLCSGRPSRHSLSRHPASRRRATRSNHMHAARPTEPRDPTPSPRASTSPTIGRGFESESAVLSFRRILPSSWASFRVRRTPGVPESPLPAQSLHQTRRGRARSSRSGRRLSSPPRADGQRALRSSSRNWGQGRRVSATWRAAGKVQMELRLRCTRRRWQWSNFRPGVQLHWWTCPCTRFCASRPTRPQRPTQRRCGRSSRWDGHGRRSDRCASWVSAGVVWRGRDATSGCLSLFYFSSI
mmetsp:Transcript_48940/g.153733  ORF Transcript_48940/g.153733 Transcript_48940/m.153733 type:complete len:370 (+) Transcript_48940:519-1628(+)